jgi:1-deoxy-D-xylulose-5-phosphate reductoisomerase
MTSKKILVLGSTGKLGSLLINFCSKKKIPIYGLTCHSNNTKLKKFQNKVKSNNNFILSNTLQENNFLKFLKTNKFDIIYFLDYGCSSLKYLDIILKNNKKSLLAIANKEMLVAGGAILRKKILSSNNILVPLDSEHFSLFRLSPKNSEVKKIYITASGGPFYFKKNIDLNKVSFNQVVKHPKWEMGINNSIDSSNFINKVLEIFELSAIYDIDINKIDFLVTKEAFIHSYVLFNDNTISINCFPNDMLIPLLRPLSTIINLDKVNFKPLKNDFNVNNFKLENYSDHRFMIPLKLRSIKKFNHQEQIKFMIYNNIAHKLYINRSIRYNQIPQIIFKKMKSCHINYKLKSFNDILKYVKLLEGNHVQN